MISITAKVTVMTVTFAVINILKERILENCRNGMVKNKIVGGGKKNKLIDYPMIIINFFFHIVPRTDIWWTCPPSATRCLVDHILKNLDLNNST